MRARIDPNSYIGDRPAATITVMRARVDRRTQREVSVGVVIGFVSNIAAASVVGTVALASGIVGDLTTPERRALRFTLLAATVTGLYVLAFRMFRPGRRHDRAEHPAQRRVDRDTRARNVAMLLPLVSGGLFLYGVLAEDEAYLWISSGTLLASLVIIKSTHVTAKGSQSKALHDLSPSRDTGFPG